MAIKVIIKATMVVKEVIPRKKKKRPICTYCDLIGHIADKCYKFYGYPPGYKPKGGNKVMANQVSTVLPSGNFGG